MKIFRRIAASTALLLGAGLVQAAPGAAAAAPTRYEAENASYVSGSTVDDNFAGYSGTGFVNTPNSAGSYVEFTVNAAGAGNAKLALRYANGTTEDRPADIAVNGTVVKSGYSFPPTSTWSAWTTTTVSVPVGAGSNKVRLTATGSGGLANTDYLDFELSSTDTQVPSRPGQPSCSAISEDGLALSWGASTDNVGVAAYDIYEHGNKISEAAGSANSKALTGLSPNTTYNLTVIARDAAGNASAASPVVDCTTSRSTDTTAPSRPGTLSAANVAATSAELSWGAATDDRAVVGYDVRSGSTVYKTVTGTSTSLTGLACNSPYGLNVVARDAAGNVSEQSNTVSFTTKACVTDGGVPSSIATVSSGWTIPWGTYWMPDGQTALITERDDFRVWKVTKDGTKTQVGTVPNAVTTNGEGGLLGVAVDPKWETNHYVYFMHTASEDNRVVRMTYNGSSLTGYTVLLQGIKKNRYHNGGRLVFGPDGYLYVSTGEAQTPDLAQDKNSLNGKILRMTTDGKAAPGNPFNNYAYSYGHRNPQGLAFDRNGRLWEAEFGNSSKDELNLIKPGANYGWPTCEGTCDVSGMTNPKKTWSVSEASPSGIAIARNVIYMASLRGERLWRIPITGDTENVGTATAYYVGTYGRLRTVTKVPGADQLWLSTTNSDNNGGEADGSDKIFRVSIG
ncbi:PQQ-dependent sugar dehydrogenase [Streptomyces sp. NRRL WC-3618]|uniref:PQQ-dependent sugar dehydrogenase n=1 Tax=Streptomyces sp. NRRL WC-3618 TaxID=1519490 RepID=UPI0006AE4A78|nr:PQQ-dependent sugar dehydrogenase [Streptomyces sp. NRRL WC-3618]